MVESCKLPPNYVDKVDTAFGAIQQKGLLPSTAKVWVMHSGNAAIDLDGNVYFNSDLTGCLSPQHIQSVMSHEAGHYNDPFITFPRQLAAVQEPLFDVILCAAAITYTVHKKHRVIKKGLAVVTASLFALHTLNGVAAMYGTQLLEYRADQFAAAVEGTGRTLADSLNIVTNYQNDIYRNNYPGFMQQTTNYIFSVPLAGVAGSLMSTHPDTPSRVKILRKMRAPIPMPYGMRIPSPR